MYQCSIIYTYITIDKNKEIQHYKNIKIDDYLQEKIEKLYQNNWHCDFLHSHTRQQMFKVLEQNWKSYFASIKDFGVNPNKYKGLPKPPKFKNTERNKNEIIFTNLAIRFNYNL